MKEQTYRTISEAMRSSDFMAKYIIWFNRIVTGTVYLFYPALLVLLLIRSGLLTGTEPLPQDNCVEGYSALPLDEGFIPALLIPGISFVILSIVRDRINSPRPYEVFDIPPIIDKKTARHSFPSRHIFCIFIIATTFFYYYPPVGILIGITGAALALNRVLGGVHFVKDVVVGALAGIFCGVIGFYIILPLITG